MYWYLHTYRKELHKYVRKMVLDILIMLETVGLSDTLFIFLNVEIRILARKVVKHPLLYLSVLLWYRL